MATVSRAGTSERFGFIQKHGKQIGISYLCHWLKISRSGYYTWLDRPLSHLISNNCNLSKKIIRIYHDSRGTYGSPRVHQALKKQGVAVGKKRVERLMRALKLRARVVKVTRRQPGLKRFKQRGKNLRLDLPAPQSVNQMWVADITYIKVKESYKFLSVIMDLYSRRILSWSLTHTRTTNDTAKVLNRAIRMRNPDPGLIFHTDRGIEFTGKGFRKVLKKHHMKPSVNRLGFCTDNGHMESYFHSLKAELIRGRTFNSMKELRTALNSYINHFYNKKRLHSGISYCSPVEYEMMSG
ncbi:MAG: IS3 family transposase [Methylophaga sp.]|nr:MAG: IS3 family transposase [Methylophaga sp.]